MQSWSDGAGCGPLPAGLSSFPAMGCASEEWPKFYSAVMSAALRGPTCPRGMYRDEHCWKSLPLPGLWTGLFSFAWVMCATRRNADVVSGHLPHIQSWSKWCWNISFHFQALGLDAPIRSTKLANPFSSITSSLLDLHSLGKKSRKSITLRKH